MNTQVTFRFAQQKDLPSIVDIYNQAIRSGNATADTQEYALEDRIHWFKKYNPDSYPLYIATLNDKVIGYATLSPYRSGRKALAHVAEISYYLDYNFHSQGYGSALLNHVISDCSRLGKEHLIAILLDVNTKSIGILKKFNFEKWGYFPKIARINHQKIGQVIYGLSLGGISKSK